MTSVKPLRVCIDARVVSGALGGVEQFVIGLASGLSTLTDGEELYLFLTHADTNGWITPHIQGPCQMLYGPAATRLPRWTRSLKVLPGARDSFNKLTRLIGSKITSLPRSDGLIEKFGVDVMHFTTQSAFLTNVASIYHPWDLQHLHLPQFFSRQTRKNREVAYRAFCEQASLVAVAASWNKQDIIEHYRLSEEKVRVIPVAPVLSAYSIPSNDDLDRVRKRFRLPLEFIYYPAQTWAHKNHINLLEALAILRDKQSLIVNFVSSGRLNDFFPTIEKKVAELRLANQVHFLGFVSPLELLVLYKLSRGMVFPSKFEGAGMPNFEAFLAGVPVACSDVTCLPEQVGDAALLFDPDNPEEIAAAIHRLWTDESLRKALVERGKRRVSRFTWERTARIFRAHYRRIASRQLTDEDRALLASPPLI